LRSFSQEERARFLMFVTSSSRVPLGGFTQLQGASGTQPFQIQKVRPLSFARDMCQPPQLYAKEGSLPQASTCFNLLLLPKFEAYEQLRDKLMFAVYETGGFGKA
jgi:E3 ubiquitin-protein ligase HUWE1